MKKILFLMIVTILFSSCGAKKRAARKETKQTKTVVVTRKNPKDDKKETKKETVVVDDVLKPSKNASYAEHVAYYINTYSEIAKQEMKLYKIPASITLAQGILESGAGRSDLTNRANNHFGIKCHTSWTGERVYHDDDEAQECFRKYKAAKYSFRDHSLFLSERSRYKSLFSLKENDYKGWAKGLRKAGYATDKRYPQKLIDIIEKYELYKYDQAVLGYEKGDDVVSETIDEYYVVSKGDTLYSIARKFNLSVANLMKYNKLKSNIISIGQELLIGLAKE